MECENGDPAAVGQADRKLEERSPSSSAPVRSMTAASCVVVVQNGACDAFCVGFVGVLSEQCREFAFVKSREQSARGLSAIGIHAQIKRTFVLVREAARGIVDLHG